MYNDIFKTAFAKVNLDEEIENESIKIAIGIFSDSYAICLIERYINGTGNPFVASAIPEFR